MVSVPVNKGAFYESHVAYLQPVDTTRGFKIIVTCCCTISWG